VAQQHGILFRYLITKKPSCENHSLGCIVAVGHTIAFSSPVQRLV
jgi:hypothetical protein